MTQARDQAMNEHREKLMAYIYQELQPEEARAFEFHLEDCQMCQKDLADFRQVREALAAWELDSVPHISLRLDPQPARRWIDLFRALPLWMRLMTTATAAMLVVAIFNVHLSFNATDGFQFSASLFPQSRGEPPTETRRQPSGLTEEQVMTLIKTAILQAQQQRDRQIAAQLEAWASEIRSENQEKLITFAQSLRREQDNRFFDLWDQAQQSNTVPTLFADLFNGGAGNGY